uniref:Uncharacterized protein n=1 Tax=Plectus sambesii TaxID=2011161 RepID=A0A914UK97_9BILA
MYARGGARARWELALRPHLLEPLLRPGALPGAPPGFRTGATNGQQRVGPGSTPSVLRTLPRPAAPSVRPRPNAPLDQALFFEIINFYQRRLHSFDSTAAQSTTPSQSTTGRSMHVKNRSRQPSLLKAPRSVVESSS